jgi:nitroreductase
MNKKLLLILSLFLFLLSGTVTGQLSGNSVVDAILSSYTARMFTSEPVSDGDIELILKCGIKAPSARNSQMWKFTVVKDNTISANIVRNHKPGNIVIIVSGQETAQEGINVDFDCALAIENMYIAAQGLGLGAHIYTGPVRNMNSTMKQELRIPEGYRVVSVLQVGNIDKNVDATSSASTRKSFEEIVNYK